MQLVKLGAFDYQSLSAERTILFLFWIAKNIIVEFTAIVLIHTILNSFTTTV